MAGKQTYRCEAGSCLHRSDRSFQCTGACRGSQRSASGSRCKKRHPHYLHRTGCRNPYRTKLSGHRLCRSLRCIVTGSIICPVNYIKTKRTSPGDFGARHHPASGEVLFFILLFLLPPVLRQYHSTTKFCMTVAVFAPVILLHSENLSWV